MNEEIELHIITLAEEMKRLMEENFLKPREQNDGIHVRLREIADEIVSYGFYFERKMTFDALHPGKLVVEIELYKPKKDMPPEDKRRYDDWFRKMNGLKEGD